MSTKRKSLGKGLESLFPDNNETVNDIIEIDINKIEPNRDQPRKSFDETKLLELSSSIKELGILQPILVKDDGDYYTIIAGERRWRAARIAELEKIPCIVKDFDELTQLEVALVENIQRSDLNPIEEALTYKKFSDLFDLTQEDISIKVGKSRTAIANSMRLLNLDPRVINFIVENRVSSGHARALLSLDFDIQFEIAEEIIEHGLSVRQTEEYVKNYQNPVDVPEEKKSAKKETAYKHIQSELNSLLGTKVTIRDGKNGNGKIELSYYSKDDLDRLYCLLKKIM